MSQQGRVPDPQAVRVTVLCTRAGAALHRGRKADRGGQAGCPRGSSQGRGGPQQGMHQDRLTREAQMGLLLPGSNSVIATPEAFFLILSEVVAFKMRLQVAHRGDVGAQVQQLLCG